MFRLHFFLLTCCLLVHLRAESESQVLLRYEVFRVPKVAAEAIEKPEITDAKLYGTLQQSVEAGSAIPDKMILLLSVLGQESTVRQVLEFPNQERADSYGAKPLGEQLTLFREVSDEENVFDLNIVGTATRLGPVAKDKPTFPMAKVAKIFPTAPEQIKFLGRLEHEQAAPDQANTVALAFVIATIQKFPTSNATPPENRQFRCQYEVVSLPQATALKLVQTTPDHAKLYAKINELIHTKVATLETLQMMQAREGQKCKVEHIDELPYVKIFDPAQTVPHLNITDPVLREQLLKPNLAKKTLPPPNAGSSLTIPPIGTTMEFRNLGDALEIEASVYGDGSVRVTLNAEKVRLFSMERFADVVQPSFGLQKLSTTVRLQPNIPTLIGTMNRPQETGVPKEVAESRVWLAFLTLRG